MHGIPTTGQTNPTLSLINNAIETRQQAAINQSANIFNAIRLFVPTNNKYKQMSSVTRRNNSRAMLVQQYQVFKLRRRVKVT